MSPSARSLFHPRSGCQAGTPQLILELHPGLHHHAAAPDIRIKELTHKV
jgi:hypothetical protein